MIATALLPVKPASFRLFASSFARGSLSPASRSRYNRPVVSLDIRPVTSDELDRFHFLVSYAFSSDRAPEARERMKHIEAMGQDYALYEDGEMVACLRLFPMRMFIHGASIPLSGVSHGACLPGQDGEPGNLSGFAVPVRSCRVCSSYPTSSSPNAAAAR